MRLSDIDCNEEDGFMAKNETRYTEEQINERMPH